MTSTLREQVAQAVAEAMAGSWFEPPAVEDLGDEADAAIGVVLGVVADEIKALRENTVYLGGVDGYEADVLAVLERLRG